MLFLAAQPNIAPITDLITAWIHIGQALVGSIGALASSSLWRVCHEHCPTTRLRPYPRLVMVTPILRRGIA
jgi:hypothetical protein